MITTDRAMDDAMIAYKWTIAAYHQLVNAGILAEQPVELLAGAIIEMSPEGKPHAHLSSDAADYLRQLLGAQAKIREGKPVTLPNHSEPEPDLAVIQDLGDVYLEHHPYPENIFWLIEYANSSLTKDLEVKTKIYAQAGIREYWVINLRTMELVVFRNPSGVDYQEKRTLISGQINPQAFPALTIQVARLLRRKG